jgi:hypothetical protein
MVGGAGAIIRGWDVPQSLHRPWGTSPKGVPEGLDLKGQSGHQHGCRLAYWRGLVLGGEMHGDECCLRISRQALIHAP